MALNFQTPSKELDLNQGRFHPNHFSGYILKPSYLRDPASEFDPITLTKGEWLQHKVLHIMVRESHHHIHAYPNHSAYMPVDAPPPAYYHLAYCIFNYYISLASMGSISRFLLSCHCVSVFIPTRKFSFSWLPGFVGIQTWSRVFFLWIAPALLQDLPSSNLE